MRRYSTQYIRNFIVIAALFVLAIIGTPGNLQNVQAATQNITIDGSSVGRTFDGLGGLSGGGGTSRLLWDYPATQQSQILDYLFKPNYGASLHILKVEIGGDTDTSEGAEASHERFKGVFNYHLGYEWWLMQQAKARNPNIKLYGLEWGAPGWFNNSAGGGNGIWSNDNINYIVGWIQNAKSVYGLTIDYIGGWNESGYNTTWYENLRSALNSNGLSSVQIVGDDTNWNFATVLKGNSTLKADVAIVGSHYPCGWSSGGTNGNTCPSSADAEGLGKPLWASENGTGDWNNGGAAIARYLNRDYIDGQITASINWSLVAAWYPNLPFANEGLMLAEEPWSGSYTVGKSIWATAHTSQFVQPGWKFLNANGFLNGNRNNGSYVSYKSTNNSDYSIVIETTPATSSQTVNFTITGGLSTGTVHVWKTDLGSSSSSNWFIKQSDLSGSNYSLTLAANAIYTVTTTTGQTKGTVTSPSSAVMSIPYSDNFESYTVGAMPNLPKYFSTVEGAFEVENCGGGRSGKCMRQEITQAPIFWSGRSTSGLSETFVGDTRWNNYQVSIDAMLEQSGYVELYGRVSSGLGNAQLTVVGYHLQLNSSGAWKLYYLNSSNSATTLASGTVSYGTNKWTTLNMSFNGSNILASIGGTQVANVNNSSSGSGNSGVAVSAWQNAQFDNFSVATVGSGGGTTTFDDESSAFAYTGSHWTHSACNGSDHCYDNTNSWESTTNEYATVSFTGTQIKLYAVTDKNMGFGAVSIDGGSETNVDFYSNPRNSDVLVWTSPTLVKGSHTLKIRITGTHDGSSTGNTIALDRADVLP